jgi:putative membrane-bound dehydrogenase-like protein
MPDRNHFSFRAGSSMLVLFSAAFGFCGVESSWGAEPSPAEAAATLQAREPAFLKDVKIPEGFEATLFAAPPSVNYPVFVAAAPDGTVYVSSDKNGSLDRATGRGRVLRARDLDGDGRADEVKLFVPNVDSPRGLVWDHDRLYLLHPPHLSAFIDRDGDGIAEEQKILVKNIAFGFKDRPADHSSNGIELGIDGWIYCAIGDFGFMEAEGTDGRKLQLRGGGVVRVRPDGTELELYSRGTRNILEVSVSPLLDAFARDNTNDGGGWDIRLHHFTGLGEHGYPSLFKNFADEIIQPLAIYGGGSGCGGLFLDEPGFPDGFGHALYTADWGREWIYRHHVTPKGATFTTDQSEFVRAPRVTDLDVDASSHLYVASWKGASFTYVGENVGFIVRVTPKGYTAERLPEFSKARPEELVTLLESPSHRRRLEAQRELIRRGLTDETKRGLALLAKDQAKPLASRVAAIFTVKQGMRTQAVRGLIELTKDSSLREYAIRALCDRTTELDGISPEPLLAGLADENPRVRREASFALARLGRPEYGSELSPLLNDADPIVAHTAIQALKSLAAADACFAVVDKTDAPTDRRTGALRVLQALHNPSVVDGLVARLYRENDLQRRRGLLTALCRLHYRDGQWKGDSWGTRPDTSGPYYQADAWEQTPRIATALKDALTRAKGDEAAFLVTELTRHKIQSDDLLDLIVGLAVKDSNLISPAVAQLSRGDRVPSQAIPFLIHTVTDEGSAEILRAQAVIALAKTGTAEAVGAILKALPRLAQSKTAGTERERRLAREAFLNSTRGELQYGMFENEAAKLNQESSVWADAALLAIATRQNGSQEARDSAKRALDLGWAEPKRRAQILESMILVENRVWRDKVLAAVNDPDAAVADVARRAVRTLRLERGGGRRGQQPVASPTIEKMQPADVVTAILNTQGDPKLGEELFTRQTCVNCHTVSADQPLRGPFLGNIATTYKRAELAEAILLPNKTLAQGFVTHNFELKDGTDFDGFVTQEAAERVTVRNAAAQEIQIPVKDIVKRTKREISLMPEGLVANLTVKELAALLDYLEGLAKK